MSVASGPRQRGRVARAALALGLVALALVARGAHGLPAIGDYVVVADPLAPADAVAVLGGGGRARVTEAARLFAAGYGHWLVITEMALPGLWTPYSDVVRVEATRAGVPGARILVAPGIVYSTYDEALALRQVAAERALGSLIVVTAPYHTRRARLTFDEVFHGSGVRIAIRPAEGDRYRPDSWWQDATSRRETCMEYGKLLVQWAGGRPTTRDTAATPSPGAAPPPAVAAPAAPPPWPVPRIC